MRKDRFIQLLKEARAAQKSAYAPYSNYRVGAALLTGNGKVYKGANIENASFGESLCAEKVAVGQAVFRGDRDFVMLVVVGSNGQQIPPCGSCRQVVSEFSPDCLIAVPAKTVDGVELITAKDLLPHTFRLDRKD